QQAAHDAERVCWSKSDLSASERHGIRAAVGNCVARDKSKVAGRGKIEHAFKDVWLQGDAIIGQEAGREIDGGASCDAPVVGIIGVNARNEASAAVGFVG